MTKQEFIAAAIAAARESSARSGFPAGITVAQAGLESAWGESLLARAAHNYFGIKAHDGLPWVEFPTTEVIDGVEQRATARFARYASMAECFADRDALLARLPCYAAARAAAADPAAFARALAARWATDPLYAEKLLAVYRVNGLAVLDEERD